MKELNGLYTGYGIYIRPLKTVLFFDNMKKVVVNRRILAEPNSRQFCCSLFFTHETKSPTVHRTFQNDLQNKKTIRSGLCFKTHTKMLTREFNE